MGVIVKKTLLLLLPLILLIGTIHAGRGGGGGGGRGGFEGGHEGGHEMGGRGDMGGHPEAREDVNRARANQDLNRYAGDLANTGGGGYGGGASWGDGYPVDPFYDEDQGQSLYEQDKQNI